MKFLVAIFALVTATNAFAHDSIVCKADDKSAYVFLNLDGNGNQLVTSNLRVGTEMFNADIKPAHWPLRRQATPLTVTYASKYVFVLGLSEKTAIVSELGEKNEFGWYKPTDTPEKILKCCNPRNDFNPRCEDQDN